VNKNIKVSWQGMSFPNQAVYDGQKQVKNYLFCLIHATVLVGLILARL